MQAFSIRRASETETRVEHGLNDAEIVIVAPAAGISEGRNSFGLKEKLE